MAIYARQLIGNFFASHGDQKPMEVSSNHALFFLDGKTSTHAFVIRKHEKDRTLMIYRCTKAKKIGRIAFDGYPSICLATQVRTSLQNLLVFFGW